MPRRKLWITANGINYIQGSFPLWLQTRCLEPVLTPKLELWIAASGTTSKAMSRFGSRPAVWSPSSCQNVSLEFARPMLPTRIPRSQIQSNREFMLVAGNASEHNQAAEPEGD